MAREEGHSLRLEREMNQMNEKEGKNRWIVLFIIVAILSLIGVSVLTFILHKVFRG